MRLIVTALIVLGPGNSMNFLAKTHQLSLQPWASSKWHPVMSRLFRNHPKQYRSPRPFRNHLEQFRNTGTYSTSQTLLYPWKAGKYHPPMGDWAVPPTPYNNIPQHRVPPDHLAAP